MKIKYKDQILETVGHYHLDAISDTGDYIYGFTVVKLENDLIYIENTWDEQAWKPFEVKDVTPSDGVEVVKAFPSLVEAVKKGIEIIRSVYKGAKIVSGAGCPDEALEELCEIGA